MRIDSAASSRDLVSRGLFCGRFSVIRDGVGRAPAVAGQPGIKYNEGGTLGVFRTQITVKFETFLTDLSRSNWYTVMLSRFFSGNI